ncbi:glycosyltransferase, group 1 family protein [delta proteobacterium NaphS2]|nr:glycosyltransferase, group 1 family protein [delta proteobacterium NaphS2]
MIRVMHVITDLDIGGAEVMLAKLIGATDLSRFNLSVLSLKRKGVVAGQIERLGIPIFELNLNRPFSSPRAILKFREVLSRQTPEVIQGWMYHGNLAASVLHFLNPDDLPVIWNIRHSLNHLHQEKSSMRLLIRAGAFYSKRPAAIIYNAHISLNQHEAVGYFPENAHVIPNGFDLQRFRSDPETRQKMRSQLGVPEDGILIGLIARYNPMKDHANFLRAASLMAEKRANVRFLLIGRNVDNPSSDLTGIIDALGLTDKVIRLGERSDVVPFYAALDMASLSSAYGEGFPNFIGEAMACRVPCVVTDVGDCRRLVGDTGIIVPVKDPAALKKGWEKLIDMGSVARYNLGLAARKRIHEKFAISKIAGQYESLYESFVESRSPEIR